MFEQARKELSTLRDLIRFSVSRLNQAGSFFGHGTNNAWDEAVYLTLHALHLPPQSLTPYLDAHVTREERDEVLNLLEKRITKQVPSAYLTHEAWLGDFRFYVDERVIVPRSHLAPLLEEQLTPWANDPFAVQRVLDLCTGSGCLAILAAFAFPNAQLDAVDISLDALAVAKKNVDDYALTERITLVESDAFTKLGSARYDIILSNPPYVRSDVMARLPQEYRREPALALHGGEDGLDFVRIILREAAKHLTPEGMLIVEIGDNRQALEDAFPTVPFIWLETGRETGRENDNENTVSPEIESVFMLRQGDLPT